MGVFRCYCHSIVRLHQNGLEMWGFSCMSVCPRKIYTSTFSRCRLRRQRPARGVAWALAAGEHGEDREEAWHGQSGCCCAGEKRRCVASEHVQRRGRRRARQPARAGAGKRARAGAGVCRLRGGGHSRGRPCQGGRGRGAPGRGQAVAWCAQGIFLPLPPDCCARQPWRLRRPRRRGPDGRYA